MNLNFCSQANEGIKKEKKSQNALHMHFFYKVPIETSKLARDDICIETKCPYIFMPDTIFLRTWNTMVAIIIVVILNYK